MTSTIGPELAHSFEDASADLIESIRRAIRGFQTAPPDHRAAWESRQMPQLWETEVLPNLEDYHNYVQAALRAYHSGDIRLITREAASYKGLSKDMDGYHMDWMLEPDRLAVGEAIHRVIGVADQIHRLGYHELERTGRL
jgi:hypothetical protein